MPDKPAPPEPREPEAREAAAELLLQYPDIDEYYATDKPITRATAIEFALAYSAELRAALARIHDYSLIWMAIRDSQDTFRDTIKRTIRDANEKVAAAQRGEATAHEAQYQADKRAEASERSLLQARAWVARLWELGEFTGACGSALGEDGELAEILRLASTSAPSSAGSK